MWSDDAWKAIEPIYEKILNLDFVRELGDGTLDQTKFLTYMEQDKLYLNEYARALSLIAARSPDVSGTTLFAEFSQTAAAAEQSLHDFYIAHLGGNTEVQKQLLSAHRNVTCELYTSFLLRHAALSPIEVAAAAVLPCFWIYDAVGVHHTDSLATLKSEGKQNQYARWIELYSSPDFTEGTAKARAFADKLAENSTEERRREMTEVFVKASIMELMFWKAAYDDERWIA